MDKVFASKLLEAIKTEEGYTLRDLFTIRDALLILKDYGFADLDLLEETQKHIKQKQESQYDAL